ncbi:hypothetical protein [Paenibacillus sp. DMB5]|uniref:hypothetical protein n=1 Tax=Paenibacillus sp. DMB5 TaxID=1780103 RepID=UPI00076D40A9|nr:hypothetical protein [Paenibacillus sp. DMB5]KUP24602.1 hypothetical protein AWJ19_19955 [Paenibacillus sp. DMB5]
MIDWRWAEVDALESQGKWNEAKELLINHWSLNPDVKATIRLGFFCWYLLVEDGPLELGIDIDFNGLESFLHQVTAFGLANFMDKEDFLWCFGYIITLFPYFFGEYELWEEKGKELLKEAHKLDPDEPVYKYSYLWSLPISRDKNDGEFEEVRAVLEERFQGEGVLSRYFKSVWY